MISNADSGPGSLRDALYQVNAAASSGVTTIDFNIGSGGLATIALKSALPVINYPVTIDGTSQPGTSTTPRVEINGALAGGGVVGLDLFGGNSTVEGLVVDGFGPSTSQLSRPTGIGILLDYHTEGDVVQGCFIGTDPTGTKASGNEVGVKVDDTYQGFSAVVGGTTAATRNLISGNGTGVVMASGMVEGNDIGTDPTGTVAVPNVTGISVLETLYGAPPSGFAQGTIGGSVAGSGNVISGNSGVGISFNGGMNFLTQGNTIGLGSSGGALGNGGNGIAFVPQATQYSFNPLSVNDPIGGTLAGQGNTIAGNAGAGVDILPSTGHYSLDNISITIRGNSIYGNGGPGIDLGDDGVSANPRFGPIFGGPNFLQANPVISSVTTSGGSTTVTGTFDGTPSSAYTIDFYGSATADPTRFGQGQQFLTTLTLITDDTGHKQFSSTFATPSGLPFITATATDQVYGNTSEFSEAVSTTSPPLKADLSVTESASVSQARFGQSVVFTSVVTNNGPDPAVGASLYHLFLSPDLNDFSLTKFVVVSAGITTSKSLQDGGIDGRILLGTIASGQSATVQFTYSSSTENHNPFSEITGIQTNNVVVTSAVSDPNQANNQTSASFNLIPDPVAKLSLATTPLPGRFFLNVPLTITIQVSNVGNADATNVLINDTPPGAIDSYTSSQGTTSLFRGAFEFNLGTIAPGATATITIVFTPTHIGLQTNSGAVNGFISGNYGYSGYSGTANFDLLVLPRDVRSDFDGDGKTDIAEFIPSTSTFAIRPSSGGLDRIIQFGIPGVGQSLPATGDYDGDGQTDLAVYLPSVGAFAIRPSTGGGDQILPFGIPGVGQSIPAPGDYDGDGKTDLAVYLPAFGDYAYRRSSGGGDRIIQFGAAGAGQSIPDPGDYDGDGITDLAVYLPKFGLFALRPSSGGGDRLGTFGAAGAGQTLPAPGDYDGDGITDIAATLPAYGLFAVRPSSGGGDRVGAFGPAGLGQSVPVSGLASLSVTGSGVQAASVASVSSASTSKVTTHSVAIASVLPSGPTRKALVVAQGGRRLHHQPVAEELS